MRTLRQTLLAAVAITFVSSAAQADPAQDATPGFNTKIPESVLTPDTVETKLGTLKFFDGIPDAKAADRSMPF
jgi:hypothetical protein